MANKDLKKKLLSNTYLIVDSRERAVIPFIETEIKDHEYICKQINTGDYLICKKSCSDAPTILACIERKTHEDFAASFKDGRYENIKKMLTLRELTGCQLYFFIEGAAFPRLNRKFARICFSSILAAITKLMVRNGIFIVQTENESHSAKRIEDFLNAFDEQTEVKQTEVKQTEVKQTEVKQTEVDQTEVKQTEVDQTEVDQTAVEQNEIEQTEVEQNEIDQTAIDQTAIVPNIVTDKIEQTDTEATFLMWSRLHGISIVLGKLLTKEFTIAELATGIVLESHIRSLKTATGRTINKDAISSLLAIQSGSLDISIKLISGLRNITPAVATAIINAAGGLSQLCTQNKSLTAIVEIQQKNRTIRFGKTRADRVHHMLHYKDVI